MAGHVYHWKHGWIPLDHEAALSKAKGDHKAASDMLSAAHSPEAGIHTKQHVAKAALGVSSIHSQDQRSAAMQDVQSAAKRLNAEHLIPGQKGGITSVAPTQKMSAGDVKAGDVVQVPSVTSNKTKRFRIDKTYAPHPNGDRNVDATNLDTGASVPMTLEGLKQHTVERKR